MALVRIIPLMKSTDMKESVVFYRDILGFEHVGTWPATGSPSFSVFRREGIDIQLSTHSGDGVTGTVVFIEVSGIDALFKEFLSRGLDTTAKRESPVHQGPLNQSWGWREFYVTDPSGNTIRFGEEL